MKKYIVRVNGTAYEVEVEEVENSSESSESVVREMPKKDITTPQKAQVATGSVAVNSPMAGTILKVLVKTGDKVTRGQAMFVLEALKMENNIPAPKDGTVVSVSVNVGDAVETDAVVATLD